MNSLLLQLVALTSSFLLALPAGWCSGLMHDRTDSVPVQATCCQTEPQEPSSPQQTPTERDVGCCCSWDGTLPQKSVQPDDSSSAAVAPPVAGFTADFGLVTAGKAVVAPFHSGPRLYVLQCVWRC